jgi:hypothetical protein
MAGYFQNRDLQPSFKDEFSIGLPSPPLYKELKMKDGCLLGCSAV